MPKILDTYLSMFTCVFKGLEQYPEVLEKYPALRPYVNDVDPMLNILGDTGAHASRMPSASGFTKTLLNEDFVNEKSVATELKNSLNDVHELLKDKDLMEKEPYMCRMLKFYDAVVSKGFSSSDDRMLEFADENTNLAVNIFAELNTTIPSKEFMEHLRTEEPGAYEAGIAMIDYMDAVADILTPPDMEEQLTIDHAEEEFSLRQRQKYARLKAAGENLATAGKENIEKFLVSNGDTKGYAEAFTKELFGKKDLLNKAIETSSQISQNLNNKDSNLTIDDAMMLKGIPAELNTLLSDMKGGNYNPKDMMDKYRKPVEELMGLADECKRHYREGFFSTEDKEKFYEKLNNKINECVNAWDDYNEFRKTNPDVKGEKSTIQLLGGIYAEATKPHGTMNMLRKRQDTMNAAANPVLREQIAYYHEMMKETGEGYLFHSNSKEYNNMMKSLEIIEKYGDKKDLTEVEKKALYESCNKLADRCSEYLSDKLGKSQNSGTGKDRFAGAMGILKTLDPDRAEKLRLTAEQKRGNRISWKDLDERAEKKAVKRERKNPQPQPVKQNNGPAMN